ncbi:MAG: hypothetical protein WC294_06485 [Methanoregula sp.]|jgi:hypothetical protein
MAATTTELDPILFYRDRVITQTTNIAGSTAMMRAQAFPGGIRLSTAGDVVRIPFNRPDGKMVIVATYLENSTIGYPAIHLRNPPSTDRVAWRAPGTGIGTSTAASGWKTIESTSSVELTTAQIAMVTFGPFESARYGHVMAASSNGIDAKQPFLECVFDLSTATGSDFLDSTGVHFAACNIQAFELP